MDQEPPNRDGATLPPKPGGFPVWLGRGLAAALLLAATGIAIASLLDGNDARPTAAPGTAPGIRLN